MVIRQSPDGHWQLVDQSTEEVIDVAPTRNKAIKLFLFHYANKWELVKS